MAEEWFSPYYLKEQTLDFSILLLLFLTVNLLSVLSLDNTNTRVKNTELKIL